MRAVKTYAEVGSDKSLILKSLPVAPGLVFVIEILLLVLWIIRFRSVWVKTAALAYAERLIAACESL